MSDATDAVTVEGHDHTSGGVDDLQRWCDVARRTLVEEGARTGRLDLVFVDVETMTELNRDHLGYDEPTDVLAFPLDGLDAAAGDPTGPGRPGPVPVHLGDVVVCPAVASSQAADRSDGFEAELTLLVVHGVLHVLGHDHRTPAERTRMQGRERHHLARHGFVHPVEV